MTINSIYNKVLGKVVAIEKLVYGNKAWTISKFKSYLSAQHILCNYLEAKSKEVMGYVIAEDTVDNITILNMTCNPDYEEEIVIGELIAFLQKKLKNSDRCIRITVRDTSLELQKFLKGLGFKGKLLPNFFNDGQDGITFVYRREEGV
jgi:ribosomal protein S18 acetylase RimI-like enzyme